MLVTGKREHKEYLVEHHEEEKSQKVFFEDGFRTEPRIKGTEGFTVTLDQEEAPYVSCTVSKKLEAEVSFLESPKTVRETFTLEVAGYK